MNWNRTIDMPDCNRRGFDISYGREILNLWSTFYLDRSLDSVAINPRPRLLNL